MVDKDFATEFFQVQPTASEASGGLMLSFPPDDQEPAFAASSYFSDLGSDQEPKKQEAEQFVTTDLFQDQPFDLHQQEQQLQQEPVAQMIGQEATQQAADVAWYQSELVR